MRWPFVVAALAGCGPPPRPGVAVAPTPVLEDTDRGVSFDDDGAIVCGATRTELPRGLAITDVSEETVVAASPHGIVQVAHDGADMLATWAQLHRDLEGALADDQQLDANVDMQRDVVVIDYAQLHGARLRFAYRHSDRCTVAAIERAAAPIGAVAAVTHTEPTDDALPDCLAHRRDGC